MDALGKLCLFFALCHREQLETNYYRITFDIDTLKNSDKSIAWCLINKDSVYVWRLTLDGEWLQEAAQLNTSLAQHLCLDSP